MLLAATRDPDGSIRLVLAVLGVAVLGWIGVIAFHSVLMTDPDNAVLAAMPPSLRGLLSFCGTVPDIAGPGLGNWIMGWSLMVVSMMLPPALPLMRAVQRLLKGRDDRILLMLLVPAAFVAIWILSGGILFTAGSLARAGLRSMPEIFDRPDIAAALAAIAVGLFQFTPLKMSCMDACRSPASVMMVTWKGASPRLSALRIGARYGAICVGCCWAMMLLGVLAGAMMLPIMVICALMMSLERLLPVFRPLIPLQAGFAILIGSLLLLGAIPPAFF